MDRMILKTAAAVFLAMSVAGCAETDKAEDRHEAIPVKAISVGKQSGTGIRTYVGTVSPVKSAVISGNYPGTVVRIPVSQGDFVKKGELIAEIYSQSIVSSREMAHATLKQAEDGYARLSQVHGSGSVADVKMVEIETQLSKARAAAEAADKALEDCMIKAPFDGVIGETFIEQGVEVTAAAPIARLLDISSVEISFQVPENEISSIGKGSRFTVTVPAAGDMGFQASFKSKGIVASPFSHSYSCTAVPEARTPGLMPGMVCKISTAGTGTEGIVIPASVIRTDMEGRYVWLAEGQTVEKRYVTTGGFSGKGVIILEGLSEGDQVISEGIQKVSSGMKVRVIEQ